MTAVDKSPSDAEWLTGLWYLAGISAELKYQQPIRRTLFGQAMVLGRERAGSAFALQDQCAHRGAPLSAGQQHDVAGRDALHCPYHGWAFETKSGGCVAIPALSNRDAADFTKIRIRQYRLHEENGLIWIYHGDDRKNDLDEIPILPFTLPPKLNPRSVTVIDANGRYDEAVTGLVDPAHTPFVHQQWWWRKGQAAREKTKNYELLPIGFRMPAHTPSGNSKIYKFLGGKPTTEIDFLLPGIRIETIRTDKHLAIGLTAITPIDGNQNRIIHCLFWDLPILTMLKPIVDAMAASFLAQDGAILDQQAENLAHAPHTPLYMGEPDTPAKWYRQLARAWAEQQHEQVGAFVNPIKVGQLHWKT